MKAWPFANMEVHDQITGRRFLSQKAWPCANMEVHDQITGRRSLSDSRKLEITWPVYVGRYANLLFLSMLTDKPVLVSAI